MWRRNIDHIEIDLGIQGFFKSKVKFVISDPKKTQVPNFIPIK